MPVRDDTHLGTRTMEVHQAATATPVSIDEIGRTFGKRSAWQKSLMTPQDSRINARSIQLLR